MKRKAETREVRSVDDFAAELVNRWPELAVKPGHEEIENPDSELAQIRARCVLTASRAGILWNCSGGVSPKRYVEEKLGLVKPAPFSEFAKHYMEQGRIMEPQIANRATFLLWAELRQITGGTLDHRSPGPYVSGKTSATPDGLWQFRIDGTWYVLPFEIKFFASKNELPEAFPDHYIAQVVMQMVHAHSRVAIAIGCVKDSLGNTPLRFWKIQLTDELLADYKARLKRLKTWMARKTVPGNQPREGHKLHPAVVGFTSDTTDVWEFIMANLGGLVRWPDGEELVLPI